MALKTMSHGAMQASASAANGVSHSEGNANLASKLRTHQSHQIQTSAWHCLILSPSHEQREIIGQSAFAAGWLTLSCENASDALKHLCRNMVKLVIIDLQGNCFDNEAIRRLSEHVIWSGGMLLVAIGDQENEKAESWCRQLGVWSYLPGVNGQSDLTSLCTSALEVTDKLNKPFFS